LVVGKSLTIIVGGNAESDFGELFSGKHLSEIKQPRNALYLDSFEQLNKIVSPKRMDLLRYLMDADSENNPKSVSQIAIELGRHQEAISRDIATLRKLGLVMLKKIKQTVYVIPQYNCINIKIC